MSVERITIGGSSGSVPNAPYGVMTLDSQTGQLTFRVERHGAGALELQPLATAQTVNGKLIITCHCVNCQQSPAQPLQPMPATPTAQLIQQLMGSGAGAGLPPPATTATVTTTICECPACRKEQH